MICTLCNVRLNLPGINSESPVGLRLHLNNRFTCADMLRPRWLGAKGVNHRIGHGVVNHKDIGARVWCDVAVRAMHGVAVKHNDRARFAFGTRNAIVFYQMAHRLIARHAKLLLSK